MAKTDKTKTDKMTGYPGTAMPDTDTVVLGYRYPIALGTFRTNRTDADSKCPKCGHDMNVHGACHQCVNCGNSFGC